LLLFDQSDYTHCISQVLERAKLYLRD
jgi:hypothetical protein